MDLINEIRLKNGLDPEVLKRVAMDPDIANSMNATLENLEQALKNLSDELYTKSTHFVFEFVQNADDNSYAPSVIPTLHMRVEDRQVSFHCNEVGFNRENVDAICRVGASTKKNIHGYIGEKGIGFKSVFKVADVVFISSGPYTFKLDKRQKLGMITPIWTDEHPVSEGWTSFYLHLPKDGKELAAYTEDVKPSLLLFLRQLRSLTIEISLSSPDLTRTIQMYRYDTDDADIVNLERILDGDPDSLYDYFMIKHMVRPYMLESKRKNVKETEIVLAFPITDSGAPAISMQDVHAFLPLRKYGFSFIIQGDFLTSTSREDILSDLQWNLILREGVVDAFLRAVERFKQRSSLRYVWFRFLPRNISDPFFKRVEDDIKLKLRNAAIFRSTDGKYRLPSEVITVPARFCDDANQPLIPERFCIGMHHLSMEYDVAMDGVHFTDLGVREMSDEQFIQGLARMKGQFSPYPEDWHEAVCATLLTILGQKWRIKSDIQRLGILPLSNGTWTSSDDARDIFFDTQLADIPEDLGLCILKAGIQTYSARYRLFEELGVKQADALIIAGRILVLHGSPAYRARDMDSLICHAQFMFAHQDLRGFPLPTNLRIMDERGDTAKGSELYMDLPWSGRMRNALPQPPARFIHPDYFKAHNDESKKDWWQWRQWLQGYLHINVSPRLIGGNLSPEFEEMTRTLESREFLVILKVSWSHLEGKLSQKAILDLAQTVVICEDGSSQAISATYIGRDPLRSFDLPFLPIDDPDGGEWDFLQIFGVSTEVNGAFFIKRLVQLQGCGCQDETVIFDTYKQLEARFDDDPYGIREAFRSHPLIFASHPPRRKRWMNFSEVVWNGPHAVRSKVALRDIYPSLENLFRSKLLVNNPPVEDLLVDELKLITGEWKEQQITVEVKTQIFDILFEVNALLRNASQSTPPEWLQRLKGETIFPVDSPSDGLVLCESGDHFYVPDSSKYEKMCRGHVPLLSLERTLLHRIQGLLDSNIFRSHICYLEKAINHNSVAHGPRTLHPTVTNQYVSRLEYINRLVYHAQQPEPSTDVLKHLTSLRRLAIFSVDSIESTFSLGDFECTGLDDLTIEEEPTTFSILIGKKCPPAVWDVFICAKLGKLLDISKDKLLSIVVQPLQAMEYWLDIEGVPEIDSNSSSFRPQDVTYSPDEGRIISGDSQIDIEHSLDNSLLQNATPVYVSSVIQDSTLVAVPDLHAASVLSDSLLQGGATISRSSLNSAAPTYVPKIARVSFPNHPQLWEVENEPRSSTTRATKPGVITRVEVGHPVARRGSRGTNTISRSSLNQPSTSVVTSEAGTYFSPGHSRPQSASWSPSSPTQAMTPARPSQGNYGRNHRATNAGQPTLNYGHLQNGISNTTSFDSHLSSSPGHIPPRSFIQQDIGNTLPDKYESVSIPFNNFWGSNSQVKASVNGVVLSPDINTKSSGEAPANAYEQENGLLGECLVYNTLCRDLPDFGPNNWTSELRALVSGLTPFQGSALADFKYHDQEGVLTHLWFGAEKKEAWKTKWPTYHVEVKSTSSAGREAFHMSPRQLEIASDLTMRNPNNVPEDVYVILRVSSVRTSAPSIAIYLDPHRCFYDGELQIVTDVDVVGE